MFTFSKIATTLGLIITILLSTGCASTTAIQRNPEVMEAKKDLQEFNPEKIYAIIVLDAIELRLKRNNARPEDIGTTAGALQALRVETHKAAARNALQEFDPESDLAILTLNAVEARLKMGKLKPEDIGTTAGALKAMRAEAMSVRLGREINRRLGEILMQLMMRDGI